MCFVFAFLYVYLANVYDFFYFPLKITPSSEECNITPGSFCCCCFVVVLAALVSFFTDWKILTGRKYLVFQHSDPKPSSCSHSPKC